MFPKNSSPRSVGTHEGLKRNKQANFTKNRFKRQLNRELLPAPAKYYTGEFPNLKIKSEWVKVRCCFHSPDLTPSLSINMVNGHFRCFSCGAKGGDIISFHMQRYELNFIEAVTFLGGWSHE
jgi:hypothetical protein